MVFVDLVAVVFSVTVVSLAETWKRWWRINLMMRIRERSMVVDFLNLFILSCGTHFATRRIGQSRDSPSLALSCNSSCALVVVACWYRTSGVCYGGLNNSFQCLNNIIYFFYLYIFLKYTNITKILFPNGLSVILIQKF